MPQAPHRNAAKGNDSDVAERENPFRHAPSAGYRINAAGNVNEGQAEQRGLRAVFVTQGPAHVGRQD